MLNLVQHLNKIDSETPEVLRQNDKQIIYDE